MRATCRRLRRPIGRSPAAPAPAGDAVRSGGNPRRRRPGRGSVGQARRRPHRARVGDGAAATRPAQDRSAAPRPASCYGARHGAGPAAQARRAVPLPAAGHAAGGQPGARNPALSGARDDPRGRYALRALRIVASGAVDLFAPAARPSGCSRRPISASWSWPTSACARRGSSPPPIASCCGCTGSCSRTSAATTPTC